MGGFFVYLSLLLIFLIKVANHPFFALEYFGTRKYSLFLSSK